MIAIIFLLCIITILSYVIMSIWFDPSIIFEKIFWTCVVTAFVSVIIISNTSPPIF